MDGNQFTTTLAVVHEHQTANALSILHLAEPILSTSDLVTTRTAEATSRHHEGSNKAVSLDQEAPTPHSLNADLLHYKDLFSKLRFSYLEQVTKEKYLRSIVGDPPLLVSHEDNLVLEERLVAMKAELKERKAEVDNIVKEIEEMAVKLAEKYEKVQSDTRALKEIPSEVENLKRRIEEIKSQLVQKQGITETKDDPRMNMGLENTNKALNEQRQRNEELDRQIEILQRQMPSKTNECERAHRDLDELEKRRNEITRLAKEIRRIKEKGGKDPLEEQGKWYRSSDKVLRSLLNIEA